MVKELCLTPGDPSGAEMRAKKACGWEPAETIVPGIFHREGSNVNVLQITASKVGIIRNREYALKTGTYACGGKR